MLNIWAKFYWNPSSVCRVVRRC